MNGRLRFEIAPSPSRGWSRFLFFLVFLTRSFTLGAIMASPEHPHDVEQQEQEHHYIQRHTMAGGYREVPDLSDPRVLDAAAFCLSELQRLATATPPSSSADGTSSSSVEEEIAVPAYSFLNAIQQDEESSLKVTVVRAFQQVVAGMNYRLVLLAERIPVSEQGGSSVCVGALAATVYDRFGTLQVTHWGQELACDRAKALLENAQEFYEWSHSDFER